MGARPEKVDMASPVGSLELPEGLLQVLRGNRGEDGLTRITDLPSVVVGVILSRISNPVDVASACTSSRLFWSISRSVPFRLRLWPCRYQEGSFTGDDAALPNRVGYDAHKLVAWTRAALVGIRSSMAKTQELDLTGCPLLDEDVVDLLADLRSLDCLVLDGCQKLTSSVTRPLALSVRSGPRVISLQRCFGLGPAAAGNLLAAAAVHGSRLRAILLSHLDRLEKVHEPFLSEMVGDEICQEVEDSASIFKNRSATLPGAGLLVLALHNCRHLGHSEILAIAESCPCVEVLLLGGSGDGLGLSRPDILSQEQVTAAASALVRGVEALSRLRLLEVTFFTASVLQLVRDQISKNISVWDFCDKSSVIKAASVYTTLKKGFQPFDDPYRSGCAGNPALARDKLSILEQNTSESGESQSQFFSQEIMNGESQFRTRRSGDLNERDDSFAEGVLMALRACTNCSDIRRRTPLHVAAAYGDPEMVANLLCIGAATRGMKDSAGATALFLAAESGHAQVCNHLLRGGADVLASNRTGETPLYIAALRGHSSAVEVMLCHCLEQGINWQAADLYGDGWTPLMAATVADRQDVGKLLLWAAGASSGNISLEVQTSRTPNFSVKLDAIESHTADSKLLTKCEGIINSKLKSGALPGPALQLLDAQNRYKQTALHIAARRGSLWFVSNLLHAGASIDVEDQYGLLAVDEARKNKHPAVERMLRSRRQALSAR